MVTQRSVWLGGRPHTQLCRHMADIFARCVHSYSRRQ